MLLHFLPADPLSAVIALDERGQTPRYEVTTTVVRGQMQTTLYRVGNSDDNTVVGEVKWDSRRRTKTQVMVFGETTTLDRYLKVGSFMSGYLRKLKVADGNFCKWKHVHPFSREMMLVNPSASLLAQSYHQSGLFRKPKMSLEIAQRGEPFVDLIVFTFIITEHELRVVAETHRRSHAGMNAAAANMNAMAMINSTAMSPSC